MSTKLSIPGILRKKLAEAHVVAVDEKTLTGWATVELVDLEGDIVRVAGCDIDSARSAAVPFKLFPEHTYELPDGAPPVLGKITAIEKTVWEDGVTPAIKFTAEWATGNDGKLTPLAGMYKNLYDNGFLDSFSAGYQKLEGQCLGDGIDWTQTRLVEISATALAANQHAHIIKSMRHNNLMYKRLAAAMTAARRTKSMSEAAPVTPSLNPAAVQGEFGTYLDKCFGDMTKSLSDRMDSQFAAHADTMQKCFNEHAATLAKSMEAVHSRLDDLEGAIAVADDGPDTVQAEEVKKKLASAKTTVESVSDNFKKALAEFRADK